MASRKFGEIPGILVGTTWKSRKEVSESGAHRPPMSGISGTASEGADSIVVSGGYEDDEDYGTEIIYTGTGGFDAASGKQVSNQSFDNTNNAALIRSQLEGLPIRVIRGANGNPNFSPSKGFRYDGLFKVVDHWSELGKSGFLVCRYRLIQIENDEVIEPIIAPINLIPKGEKNPTRIKATTTRIIRNTAISEFVKKIYEYKCQVCLKQVEISKGKYAEGAHIRALGKPHNGPDEVNNVLCLCPNHHTAFDLGGIYFSDSLEIFDVNDVKIGALLVLDSHKIDIEHIKYHRALWNK